MSVSDNFDRADNADLGANWTPVSGSCEICSGGSTVNAGVRGNSGGAAYSWEVWTANTWQAAQSSQVTIRSGYVDCGPIVLAEDAGGADGYMAMAHSTLGMRIYRRDDGGFTLLTDIGGSVSAGDTIKLDFNGTSTLDYIKNGVSAGTATDSTYAANGGSAGIYGTDQHNSGATLPEIDDWVGTGENTGEAGAAPLWKRIRTVRRYGFSGRESRARRIVRTRLIPLWLETPEPETYTATASLTVGAATFSGTAEFDAPIYTGTSTLTVGAATLSGTATFTAPVYTAAGTLVVGAATLAASATFVAPVYTATSAVTTAAATLSGSATFATATFTATASLVVGAATASGTATFVVPTYTAVGTLSVGAATLSGTATFTSPVYTATSAVTVGAATFSGTAQFAAEVYLASGAWSIGAATLSGTATFSVPVYTGVGSLAVGAATLAGTAEFDVPVYTGTSAVTVGAVTLSGTVTFTAPSYTATANLTTGAAALTRIVGPSNASDFSSDGSNGGGTVWATPENAETSDNLRAEAINFGGGRSQYLKALSVSAFSSIADHAPVTEVIVTVERHSGAGAVSDRDAKLVVGGVVQSDNQAKVGDWPAFDEVVTYTFAVNLTGADVKASDFGFVLSASIDGFASANVDHISFSVKVGSTAEFISPVYTGTAGLVTAAATLSGVADVSLPIATATLTVGAASFSGTAVFTESTLPDRACLHITEAARWDLAVVDTNRWELVIIDAARYDLVVADESC